MGPLIQRSDDVPVRLQAGAILTQSPTSWKEMIQMVWQKTRAAWSPAYARRRMQQAAAEQKRLRMLYEVVLEARRD